MDTNLAWRPAISADVFLADYCERSNVTADELLLRREVQPCNCGEQGCEGWQMVSPEVFRNDLADWSAGQGPHPARLTEQEWRTHLAR